MQITNNYNLPQSFVDFARNDKYSKGNADISVNTLIDSPRVRLMRDHHHEDRVVDVVDNVWALFGTAVHHVLESSTPTEDVVLEELQRGYHLNGRVLRHALVKVSMGPGPKTSDQEASDQSPVPEEENNSLEDPSKEEN